MASGNARTHHSMQGAFIFVLLGLFALMSTLMVLLGAQMYRATVDHSQQNNEDRVLGAYMRSMLRSGDRYDAVSVGEIGGVQAVVLKEDIDGEIYATWLYQYEGQLYEQFTEFDNDVRPDGGTEICPAHSFDASIENGLLTVNMTDGRDQPCVVRMALRCAAN